MSSLLTDEQAQAVSEKPVAMVCASPLDAFDIDGDEQPDSIAFRELYHVVKGRPVTPPDGSFFKDICLRLIAVTCKLATGESIDEAPEEPATPGPNYSPYMVSQAGSQVVPAGVSTHTRVHVVDPGPQGQQQQAGITMPQLPAPDPTAEPPPAELMEFLNGTVPEISDALSQSEDSAYLRAVVAAEAKGEDRKGVREAAAARLEILAQV